MSEEHELEAAREWLKRLFVGVVNGNSAAEAVALAAFRQHGPRPALTHLAADLSTLPGRFAAPALFKGNA